MHCFLISGSLTENGLRTKSNMRRILSRMLQELPFVWTPTPMNESSEVKKREMNIPLNLLWQKELPLKKKILPRAVLLIQPPFQLSSCDLQADSSFLLTEFLFPHLQASLRSMYGRVCHTILKTHLFSLRIRYCNHPSPHAFMGAYQGPGPRVPGVLRRFLGSLQLFCNLSASWSPFYKWRRGTQRDLGSVFR